MTSAPLNPSALTPSDLARVLSLAGGEAVSEADVRADMDSGAPANADGTLSLVTYAAWLAARDAEGIEGVD